MPVFDFDGMAIAYDHAGTGDPVLFLHNLGGDRSIWAAQYQAMQATHSVYALDWFGYGDSDIPDNGYSIENYQRLLGDFIQAHGLRNVTLVGHCFGSAMALLYAKRHPEMVQALVLSSPLTAATLRPTLTGWTARIARHMRLDAIAAGLRLPALVAGWLVREQLGPFSRGIDSNAFLKLKNRWSEPRRLLPVAAVARDDVGHIAREQAIAVFVGIAQPEAGARQLLGAEREARGVKRGRDDAERGERAVFVGGRGRRRQKLESAEHQ